MARIARLAATSLASASVVALAALGASPRAVADHDAVLHAHYDGVTNDLLTAGLGRSGLESATPPGFVDPLHPTPEELRRLAIYNNYRALIDPTPGGGFGTLYGPNVTADGVVTTSQGLIAGDEYIAFENGDDGRSRVTMMVQVPDSFDPTASCIVAAPSSGSRGVYGAIATAGEWGLKHGCAVAYTDKGTGTGAHDLQNDTVNLIRGERADAAQAGDDSNFTARRLRRRARGVQCGDAQPVRLQARPLAAEPREGLGRQRAALDQVRLQGAEPEVPRARRRDRQAQHHRDRLERVERRRRVGPRRRAGSRPPDRRPRGRRAERQSEVQLAGSPSCRAPIRRSRRTAGR